MASPILTVHELRITLLDVSPKVWRQFRVPSPVDLGTLHRVVQIIMGWQDRHLHQWIVAERTFGSPEEENWGDELEDESAHLLADLAPADSSLRYDYDLSDGWEHLIEVLAIETYRGQEAPLVCLSGERACPPEDSGGPAGYEHLLDAWADPDDQEHDEVRAWLGDAFDPDEFDVQAVNAQLEPMWRTS